MGDYPPRATGLCPHGNFQEKCPRCREEKGERPPAPETEAEELERYRDSRVEFLIAEHADYVTEGNNGAIFKLNMEDLPAELRKELDGMGITEKGGDKAMKVLKVYSAGQGKREYENQRRAYEIAATMKGDPAYAQVPEPVLYRDIPISGETAAKLKGTAKNFRASDRIEVLVMDYVPGKDVATLLYREVIKYGAGTPPGIEAELDAIPFDRLETMAYDQVGRTKAREAGKSEGERIHQDFKEKAANLNNMLAYLRDRAKIQVDPRIVEQMNNTIALLHKNGLTIRDGHHRNFMVAGSFTVDKGRLPDEAPQVFMIDFDNALEIQPGLSQSEISERYFRTADTIEGVNFQEPWKPAKNLAQLTSSLEERRREEQFGDADKLRKGIASLRKKIETQLAARPNEKFTAYESRLEKTLQAADLTPDQAYLAITTHPLGSLDAKVDSFLVSAERLAERDPALAAKTRELLTLALKKARPVDLKKIADYLKK